MYTEVHNKRVLVMGLGRFGGGIGVTRWLASQGAHVTVTDQADAALLAGSIDQIQNLVDDGSVKLRLGTHTTDDFRSTDLVVANPGVPAPWKNRYLIAAAERSVPITTEIRLVVERLDRQQVIGVTGSAGKSTTVSMIHHLLSATGQRTHLGGNLGGSLLGRLDRIASGDLVVIELSSAMLYWLGKDVGVTGSAGYSPRFVLVTNLSPNHLDWHGSMEHYYESKRNISRWQQSGDVLIEGSTLPAPKPSFDLALPGQHNQINAEMAWQMAHAVIGLDRRTANRLLGAFHGLPHRLQLVGEYDGRRFYNDSKSTTPEATRLAIDAFESPGVIHLIAGGSHKGATLDPIASLAGRLAGLYTIGATGEEIADAVTIDAAVAGRVHQCRRLEAAVQLAISRMKPGDVLVLSPGCASFDQFTNFEERGHAFVRLVRQAMVPAQTTTEE